MEKKVTLNNGKEYTVKEILYKDLVGNATDDKAESAKLVLKMSTGITDEEYEILTMKDGVKLQAAVNEVNGFNEDFLSKAPLKKELEVN